MKLHRRSFVKISRPNLVHNFQMIKGMAAGQLVCPMIKANAYGHGDLAVAEALVQAGAEYLGVGLIEEGIRLRENGVVAPILLFGPVAPVDVPALMDTRLTPVLSQWPEMLALESAARAQGKTWPVHLKFNTGMNRLGFAMSELSKVTEWLRGGRALKVEAVCTHLRNGEDAGCPGGVSDKQMQLFAEVRTQFPGLRYHAYNSSALANLAARQKQGLALTTDALPMGVRPGLAIYGVPPATVDGEVLPLRPVMQFVSNVVMLHSLRKGEAVSYGGTWVAPRDARVAVIPVGYADGYFRHFSNRGAVLIRGQRAPVVGNVCMDYFMVEVTNVEGRNSPLQIGEEVILLGSQNGVSLSAGELARLADTIPYELLCDISERVPRLYE